MLLARTVITADALSGTSACYLADDGVLRGRKSIDRLHAGAVHSHFLFERKFEQKCDAICRQPSAWVATGTRGYPISCLGMPANRRVP